MRTSKHVGKYQTCVVSKVRILCKQTRTAAGKMAAGLAAAETDNPVPMGGADQPIGLVLSEAVPSLGGLYRRLFPLAGE